MIREEQIIKEAEDYFETTDSYNNYKDDEPRFLWAATYAVVTTKLAYRISELELQLKIEKNK